MIGRTLGPYEILDKLGAGGMGEVYRARDTRLGREIALKVVPPEVADDPERRARFEREARSLAALDHPGIVTIHSLESVEGITFLTMELVRGETLAARLARRRLDLEEHVDLAVALAESLAAAHERGLVHRDLKPANIMVDEAGRPRILDFGLVKLLAPEAPSGTGDRPAASLTRTGALLGTPGYMAPEQIEGRAVDARADLFALGCVLFEAATGRRAFTGDSAPAVISSILRDRPPPVSELRLDWPRDLSRIIGRCLEKDPRRRIQTARDIYNDLRELRDAIRASTTAPTLAAGGGAAGGGAAGGGTAGDGATSGGAATGGMATGAAAPADSAAAMESRTGAGQAPRRRRPAAWLVAAAVLVGVIAAAIWLVPAVRDAVSTRHGSAPVDLAVTDRPMIAVLPFETLGPPENAYFAAGITEEITSRLAGIEGLGVISRTSAVQYAGTTKSLREIGDELGVDYVLEGTVRWAPGAGGRDRVRITPQLIRVADDTHLWADQYDDVLGDVFAVQSEIARGVVRELGITLLRPGEESLAHKPTSDLAAYEAYLRALDSESRTEVIELLERAVELDPTFAEAWALLANQHAARYRFEGDATPDRLAAADSTLARATALAPENPDVLWAAAYVQYYAHDDYDRALEIFDRLLDRNPSSARACEGKAYIRRRQGRFEDAIALLEAAHQLDPRDANIVFNLAQTREATRSFESAEADYRRAIILRPEQCYYYDRWAWLALEQSGDVGEALSRVSECPGKEPSAIGLQLLFMADRHEDVLAATERMLRGTTIPTRQGALHTFRARSLRELGRTVLAESEAVIGRDLLEGAVAQGSENSFARLVLAVNLATFGQPEAAVALGKEAIALTAVDRFAGPRAELYLAAFYMHAGRMDEGVRLLERLLVARYERPVTVPLLRVGWIFEPFHDEPAFQELLERHAGDGHGT